MRVTLHNHVDDLDSISGVDGRSVYRIVQEGLTNALESARLPKHSTVNSAAATSSPAVNCDGLAHRQNCWTSSNGRPSRSRGSSNRNSPRLRSRTRGSWCSSSTTLTGS